MHDIIISRLISSEVTRMEVEGQMQKPPMPFSSLWARITRGASEGHRKMPVKREDCLDFVQPKTADGRVA